MSVFVDLRTHIAVRKMEWGMTGLIGNLGWLLTDQRETFAQPSYVEFRWMNEQALGWLMLAFCAIRLLTLFVNGRMGHVRSANTRAALSLISFGLMALWAVLFAKADTMSTGVVAYQWFALFELANIVQARSDIVKYQVKRADAVRFTSST